MGRKGDQHYSGQTHRSTERPPSECRPPPPLPPRSAAVTSSLPEENSEAPPPYAEVYHSQPLSHSWSAQDPRSSSTQSLVPPDSTQGNGKRTLLLVYIHGFMGNETSFQSFPAHVHNFVTVKLADSHVVHTKIYPRYKSRKQIQFARDAFSEWLRPHEGSETDVILLGHSMGGLLSAEVAVLQNHRLLGTINFDTPFLGMHPGVIASGLGSLFRPAPESPAPKPREGNANMQYVSRTSTGDSIGSPTSSSYFGPNASSASSLMSPANESINTSQMVSSSPLDLPVKDPNYDPPFVNDVRIPQRSGWANALHFINKHSDGLTKAAQSYVQSHLEFGGAMADYNGLKKRYEMVRSLENGKTPEGTRTTRVRFVNYYTASTGRPKKPKEQHDTNARAAEVDEVKSNTEEGVQSNSLEEPSTHFPSLTPQISVDNVDDESSSVRDAICTHQASSTAEENQNNDQETLSDESPKLNPIAPMSIVENESDGKSTGLDDSATFENTNSATISDPDTFSPSTSMTAAPTHEVPNLPPIPPAPEEPPPFDATQYPDKDTRKLAEKDHARAAKAYKQAVKDRDKAINDRRKFLEKREKTTAKEREKQMKAEEKDLLNSERQRTEKEERERVKTEKPEARKRGKEKAKAEKEVSKKAAKEAAAAAATANPNGDKPQRDKKFCMLPPKINGQIDPCWIRVFMPGVDEVGAHCALFFVDGERYQNFVTDVAGRIKRWVGEE